MLDTLPFFPTKINPTIGEWLDQNALLFLEGAGQMATKFSAISS